MQDKEQQIGREVLARIKHLERVVASYKKVSEWEMLQEGDAVVIDNSDSLHDGVKGIFRGHDWLEAGYVRLAVKFDDGKTCFYLPNQVRRVYPEAAPEVTATPTPTPAPAPTPTPAPAPAPAPESEGEDKKPLFRFPKPDEEREKNAQIIEAKLDQIKKLPQAARKGVLTASLDPNLHAAAIELAQQRGLIK
jgi:hypothetical protein